MNPPKKYENPRLYSDASTLLNILIQKHKGMDRSFRIIFMEQKIYPYLTFVMEKCLDIHFSTKEEKKQKEYLFKEMRISLELIKSYLTLCLDNKQVTQAFYFDATKRVEEISKQVLGWKNSIFQQS